jgi:hypothetical protein
MKKHVIKLLSILNINSIFLIFLIFFIDVILIWKEGKYIFLKNNTVNEEKNDSNKKKLQICTDLFYCLGYNF